MSCVRFDHITGLIQCHKEGCSCGGVSVSITDHFEDYEDRWGVPGILHAKNSLEYASYSLFSNKPYLAVQNKDICDGHLEDLLSLNDPVVLHYLFGRQDLTLKSFDAIFARLMSDIFRLIQEDTNDSGESISFRSAFCQLIYNPSVPYHVLEKIFALTAPTKKGEVERHYPFRYKDMRYIRSDIRAIIDSSRGDLRREFIEACISLNDDDLDWVLTHESGDKPLEVFFDIVSWKLPAIAESKVYDSALERNLFFTGLPLEKYLECVKMMKDSPVLLSFYGHNIYIKGHEHYCLSYNLFEDYPYMEYLTLGEFNGKLYEALTGVPSKGVPQEWVDSIVVDTLYVRSEDKNPKFGSFGSIFS